MPSVLHLLPHPGGGGETYVRLLADMPDWHHDREVLSPARNPALAAGLIYARLPFLVRRARKYDLVHVHGDTATMLALPLLRRSPGVMTTHGLHLLRRAEGKQLAVVQERLGAALTACRIAVCCSEPEREELAPLAPDAQLQVVPNGIDLPPDSDPAVRGEVRRELGVPDDAFVALYLGQLEERKDPLTAVAAAERAADAGVPVRLLVAGDGPLMEEVKAQAGSATLVLGFRDDVDRLMVASDVFVMPSEREGASFAVLEAMGRGLPMVVSDGTGNPELVGDAGVVFPLGEVDALAGSFQQIAINTERREAMGAAARRRVAEEFSRERMVEGVRRTYEQALKVPGRGAA